VAESTARKYTKRAYSLKPQGCKMIIDTYRGWPDFPHLIGILMISATRSALSCMSFNASCIKHVR